VERSLRVLDGAVAVSTRWPVSSRQSETVWRQAGQVPGAADLFVNKMDRVGADFKRTLGQIETKLQGNPVAVQLPIAARTSSAASSTWSG